MLYQPLTRQQEEKYRQFRLKKEGVVEVRPEDDLESGEIVSEPVQIPKVKLSPERFNTQNLQDELRKNMVQIMEATDKEKVEDSMDTIKKLVEEIPYLQIPKEEPLPQDTIEMPHIETDAEIDNSLKSNFKELLAEDYDGQISMYVPDKRATEPQVTGLMRCLQTGRRPSVRQRRRLRRRSSASWNPRRRVHCRRQAILWSVWWM